MSIKLMILIIILIILIIPLYKKIKNNQSQKFPKIKNKVYNTPEMKYLFWTGGYDSTFRLCQLVLDEKKPTQPIYLAMNNVDSKDGKITRKNKQKEYEIMNKIVKILKNKYPYTKKLIYPTYYVYDLPKTPKYTQQMLNLKKKHNFFHKRPINQYERLARFSKLFPHTIEVGLEDCRTGLNKATAGNRVGIGADCRVNPNLPEKFADLSLFDKMRFPIVHLKKQGMLDIAKKNGYSDILHKTWSCWYPKNGKPCGKCNMCKERIIK